MTLDQIRLEKLCAEDEIRAVLQKLKDRTGFVAVELEHQPVTVTRMDSKGHEYMVGRVVITLQSI